MNTDLNVDQLRVDANSPMPKTTAPPKKKKHNAWIYQPCPGERFLRGPIPWPWVQCAGHGKGKATQVALALWYQAGLNRSATFPFNQSRLTQMGVTRDSARRGLSELERLKLVSVKRHDGRKPIVTILLELSYVTGSKNKQNKYNWNGNDCDVEGAP